MTEAELAAEFAKEDERRERDEALKRALRNNDGRLKCKNCGKADKAAFGRVYDRWVLVDEWKCGCRLCCYCVGHGAPCPVCGGETGWRG